VNEETNEGKSPRQGGEKSDGARLTAVVVVFADSERNYQKIKQRKEKVHVLNLLRVRLSNFKMESEALLS